MPTSFKRTYVASLAVSVAALVFLPATYAHALEEAAPIVVDVNYSATHPTCITPSQPYTTIGAAIAVAAPGATIHVCPGTYAEQLTISKSLTIQGAANMGAVVIVPPSAAAGGLVSTGALSSLGGFSKAAQVLIQATNVTLLNLAVDGTGAFPGGDCTSPGIIGVGFADGSSGTLRHVALRNQNVPDGNGGYCSVNASYGVGGGILGGAFTLQDSSIRGFEFGGAVIQSATQVLIETTTIVSIPGQQAVTCLGVVTQSVQIKNNTAAACQYGIIALTDSGPGPTGSITGNTITGAGSNGILLSPISLGSIGTLTISYNTIAGSFIGINDASAPGSSNTIENNDISGSNTGIFAGPSDIVMNNTIIDATLGLEGSASAAQASKNIFFDVTTLHN